jgi:hypothetical protein
VGRSREAISPGFIGWNALVFGRHGCTRLGFRLVRGLVRLSG